MHHAPTFQPPSVQNPAAAPTTPLPFTCTPVPHMLGKPPCTPPQVLLELVCTKVLAQIEGAGWARVAASLSVGGAVLRVQLDQDRQNALHALLAAHQVCHVGVRVPMCTPCAPHRLSMLCVCMLGAVQGWVLRPHCCLACLIAAGASKANNAHNTHTHRPERAHPNELMWRTVPPCPPLSAPPTSLCLPPSLCALGWRGWREPHRPPCPSPALVTHAHPSPAPSPSVPRHLPVLPPPLLPAAQRLACG